LAPLQRTTCPARDMVVGVLSPNRGTLDGVTCLQRR
jgi:hypothetical protein